MRLFFEVTQDAASKMVSTDATHGLRVINYAAAATAVDAATAVEGVPRLRFVDSSRQLRLSKESVRSGECAYGNHDATGFATCAGAGRHRHT